MASSVIDLESQLLALAKRRVEIESQWIELSERLLAAKTKTADTETQGMIVSDMTKKS